MTEDEDRPSIPLDAEGALRQLLRVDPDAPPATRNKGEPVEEPEPLKDQGDPLTERDSSVTGRTAPHISGGAAERG